MPVPWVTIFVFRGSYSLMKIIIVLSLILYAYRSLHGFRFYFKLLQRLINPEPRMKNYIRNASLAVCLALISVCAFAQDSLLAWHKDRPLQWEDFAGAVNDSSHFDAECFAEVKYTYTFTSPQDFHFDVQAVFNKGTSWIKAANKSDKLLKHEQVHFDIAQLYACKLQQAFYNYTYTSNFAEEVLQIFDVFNKEYHHTQKLYDEQSNHSLVSNRQQEWENFVHQALANTIAPAPAVRWQVNAK